MRDFSDHSKSFSYTVDEIKYLNDIGYITYLREHLQMLYDEDIDTGSIDAFNAVEFNPHSASSSDLDEIKHLIFEITECMGYDVFNLFLQNRRNNNIDALSE